jgi:small nuclear ribonucleoprotein (snRNP)-like protein
VFEKGKNQDLLLHVLINVVRMEERQKPQNKYTSAVSGGKKTLESFIGKTIKLKTASNEEIEGLLYTYDRITNCIAIEQKASPGKKAHSFRIIKISHVKEIVSITGEQQKDYLPVSAVNVDYLKSRELDAIRAMKQQASKIGVGVTKDGQDIFNALSKT